MLYILWTAVSGKDRTYKIHLSPEPENSHIIANITKALRDLGPVENIWWWETNQVEIRIKRLYHFCNRRALPTSIPLEIAETLGRADVAITIDNGHHPIVHAYAWNSLDKSWESEASLMSEAVSTNPFMACLT